MKILSFIIYFSFIKPSHQLFIQIYIAYYIRNPYSPAAKLFRLTDFSSQKIKEKIYEET